MRFQVVNLGCKVNRVESDAFERKLAERGHRVSNGAPAELVIVNTCTVTAVAEKKTRKAVRRSLADNPEAKVVVTGCAAAQSPQTYEGMSSRVRVIPKWEMDDYLESLAASSMPHDSIDPPCKTDSFLSLGRARVGVKVQDGCGNACSYCIVHVVRGPEASVSVQDVIAGAKAASDAGAAEVVLTGINLGRYESDGVRLLGLLERLLAEQLPCRFRLSSIEPEDVDSDLIDIIAESDGRICRHLHLPLQSGSSKVLYEMRRNYSAEDFALTVRLAQKRMPYVSISTDVIAGFPGETEDDFAQTIELCKACGFSKMHVFPYSEREGTPAAARTDQIPREVRIARAEALRTLGKELRAADLVSRAGTSELAVVEDELWCTTESYHDVRTPKGATPGTLVRVDL